MAFWGRAGVLQPVVRAVVVVLASALMMLSGVTSEFVEYASARERAPASAPASDGSSDDAACVPERRVPRPGRAGRPVGGRLPVLTAAVASAGGLSGRQPSARPGEAAVAPGHARHSVLRC
ncbi:hypothetical protein [Streptomyces griseocarneus]|uniref:hypothetical protein n=1 Tax=Streptomyces griseocarneus TaxID=51201 RepID=UPI00167EEB18|nr:hypothetical protein [Streptomyces griseocarneus]MBZ6475968.1 hypothetical protein [Streptomyces griseocarneus]